VLAVGNDGQFRQLCALIDRHDMADDPRFATNPSRVEHRDVLVPILSEIFRTQTVAYWVEQLLDMGIPSGPINSVAQALTDPHVRERGMVQSVELMNGNLVDLVASPLNLSETPPQLRYPPPQLGQHTEAVLRDVLGIDEDMLAVYHRDDII
jgi:crotonobetainyl-CoA:carnitine CoA-transferase CaiB-like acyl-CoA transferase